MAKVYFLGTGSAYPSSTRDNTSLLFSFENRNILVDVSGNPARKLKELKKSLREIDTILFTHTHIDHIYGLPSLLWGMWLENRTEPLTIYVDERFKVHLSKWFETIELSDWGIQFAIHVQTFQGDSIATIIDSDELKVRTFPAKHSVPTVGLEILYNDKRIVYSADSEINSHINEYNYIDFLIHEATFAKKRSAFHSSMEEVLTSYNLQKVNSIIFVHLTDHEPYEEVCQTFLQESKVGNDIQIAYELMKVEI